MSPIQLLLVEGFSVARTNQYSDMLIKYAPILHPPHSNTVQADFRYGQNASTVKKLIQSQPWNAIIISDLSHEHNAFVSALGKVLRDYTFQGGRVAFASSDGQNLIPVLKELFDVPWRRHKQLKEPVSFLQAPIAEATIAEVIGKDIDDTLHNVKNHQAIKSSTFSNVPQSDAVFVSDVVNDSDKKSVFVNESSGFDRKIFPEMGKQDQSSEKPLNNVLVAVRRFGKGVIAYFGDEECTEPLSQLLALFCLVPRADDGNDNADTRLKLGIEAKEKGNAKFKNGKIQEALSFYEAAERHMRPAKEAYKTEYAKVLGNIAESCLKLQRWHPAIKAATVAIEVDDNSVKALYRRARAHIQAATADARLLYMHDDYWGAPQNYLKQITNALEEQLSKSRSVPTRDEAEDGQKESGRSRKSRENGTEETNSRSYASQKEDLPTPVNRPNWSWSVGLDKVLQHEWLVDCYRMRVDDEAHWRGDIRLMSLYDPDYTGDSIMLDFLVFSKLAVMMEAVPPSGWVWPRYIAKASQLLGYAFEKSDASEKYGGENIFSGMLGMGSGRSFRFTAWMIYGTDVFTSTIHDDRPVQLECEIRNRLFGGNSEYDKNYVINFDSVEDLFDDVGGVQIWKRLKFALRGVRSTMV